MSGPPSLSVACRHVSKGPAFFRAQRGCDLWSFLAVSVGRFLVSSFLLGSGRSVAAAVGAVRARRSAEGFAAGRGTPQSAGWGRRSKMSSVSSSKSAKRPHQGSCTPSSLTQGPCVLRLAGAAFIDGGAVRRPLGKVMSALCEGECQEGLLSCVCLACACAGKDSPRTPKSFCEVVA